MIAYLKIAAVILMLALGANVAFDVFVQWQGVLARVAYPQGVSFTGISHFGRATYAGVNWFRLGSPASPCPLVIHLPEGDLGADDLARPSRLAALGFKPDLPDAETSARIRQVARNAGIRPVNLPPHFVRSLDGVLISVGMDPDGPAKGLNTVFVGYRMASPAWPRRPGIVTVLGKALPLPVTQGELETALGRPSDTLPPGTHW